MATCVFCCFAREVIAENEHATAFYDIRPVSKGHALIVPRRHAVTVWELTADEYAGCFALVCATRETILACYAPDGFNIGVNCGEAAGQTVWHAHIHLIPRYRGDVPNPRGGVRNMIPHAGHE